AIALAERVDVPVLVRKQLDLHMPGTLEVALEEDGLVAECSLGLAARRGDGVRELPGLANDSHSAAATACGRLDQQWQADLDGLIGLARMQRALVVRRDGGDGRDPFGCAGAEDPDGDLAAVGYEELPDLHAAGRLSRNARRPSCPSGLVRSLAASRAASSPP